MRLYRIFYAGSREVDNPAYADRRRRWEARGAAASRKPRGHAVCNASVPRESELRLGGLVVVRCLHALGFLCSRLKTAAERAADSN